MVANAPWCGYLRYNHQAEETFHCFRYLWCEMDAPIVPWYECSAFFEQWHNPMHHPRFRKYPKLKNEKSEHAKGFGKLLTIFFENARWKIIWPRCTICIQRLENVGCFLFWWYVLVALSMVWEWQICELVALAWDQLIFS